MAAKVNKKLISENEAILLKPTFTTATGTRQMWRGWEIPDPDIAAHQDWLEQYTSVKNSKPNHFVKDPETREGNRHEGEWVCASVFYDNDNSKILVQVLELVTTIDKIKDLSGMDYLLTSENEILTPFGIVSGEKDYQAYVFKNLKTTSRAQCEEFSDAELVANLPGAGWTYVDRKFQVEENNTGTFTVIFQKVQWNAWGHDDYAADTIEYPNAGTKNEKENLRKTWKAIQKADLSTAIQDCREGSNVPAPSGYVITDAGVTDNRDGSITLTQVCRKQVNNRDLDDTRKIRPHGWKTGTLLVKTTAYEDFYAADIDSATSGESVPAGYVLSAIDHREAGGLQSRHYIYEKATWVGTWTTNKKKTGVQYEGKESELQTHTAKGLPKDGIDTLFESVGADTGYCLLSKVLQEGGYGEQVINRRQQKLNDGTSSSDALVIVVHVSLGDQSPLCKRQWYRRSEAAKNILIDNDPQGEASKNFTFQGVAYSHARWTVTDHHDGAYTVTQVAIDYSGLGGVDTSINCYKPHVKSYVDEDGNLVTLKRLEEFTLYIKYRASRVEAWTAINQENTKTIVANSMRVTRFADYLYEGRFLHWVGPGEWEGVV